MTVNLATADKYFQTRINSQAWDNASQSDKEKALTTSARMLESYRCKVDTTRFYYAIYEQAIWLLSGDSRAELQQAGVQSMGFGDLSESYQLQGRDPSIAPQAWTFLRGPSLKAGGLI